MKFTSDTIVQTGDYLSEDEMKTKLVQQPFAAMMVATQNFQMYKSGIFGCESSEMK